MLDQLKSNVYVKKFLGSIIAILNVINAKDWKLNRADGFDIRFLKNLETKKDSNGKPFFHQIILDLSKKDDKLA